MRCTNDYEVRFLALATSRCSHALETLHAARFGWSLYDRNPLARLDVSLCFSIRTRPKHQTFLRSINVSEMGMTDDIRCGYCPKTLRDFKLQRGLLSHRNHHREKAFLARRSTFTHQNPTRKHSSTHSANAHRDTTTRYSNWTRKKS